MRSRKQGSERRLGDSREGGDSKIVITTTSRLAGAIHSLTWSGHEFINTTNHGRNYNCLECRRGESRR